MAKSEGMAPLVRAMRAELAALGPNAPFPTHVLDYPNRQAWNDWMREFAEVRYSPEQVRALAAARQAEQGKPAANQ